AAVADGPARHPTAMEWVLRLPLHLGISACALAEGRTQRAAEEAALAAALAAQPGERTYLALAERARAAAAIAERRRRGGEAALSAAHAAVAGDTAPVAEWQVWSTAAALADGVGDAEAAARHRARSAAVLDRLAASLDDLEPSTAAGLGISIASAQRAIRAQVA